MDNWCILKEAKNTDAAYDFINFILEPENSLTDLEFHGYNTGIKGIEELAGDIVVQGHDLLHDEQVATMKLAGASTPRRSASRHLQQGEGQGRQADRWRSAIDAPSAPPPQKFRLRARRSSCSPFRRSSGTSFLFVIPVALVLVNSFGTKVEGSPGRVDLSNPTLDRYREVARRVVHGRPAADDADVDPRHVPVPRRSACRSRTSSRSRSARRRRWWCSRCS